MERRETISLRVNGTDLHLEVEPRKLLLDALREDLGLTGVHAGCEHGVCGACTVLVANQPIRSCLMFAIQAEGSDITTVEGLETRSGLHPMQRAFWDQMGFQCGYCTPGMILTAVALSRESPEATEPEIKDAISGNLCRCTGYEAILRSIQHGLRAMREDGVKADGRN